MKDWKKSLTSTKEEPPVTGVKKHKGLTSPANKASTGQLEKKDNKGEDDMEDFDYDKVGKVVAQSIAKVLGEQREQERLARQQTEPVIKLEKRVSGVEGEVLDAKEQLKGLQEKLKPFGQFCTTVEECQAKIKELEETPAEEPKEKTLDEYSAQEKYDSIKTAPSALGDLDNIYAGRFAEDPEYRKLALEKLPDEVFVELAKEKAIETKLTALCNDEVCRTDVVAKIKEVEKSTGKKLL